jgi:bla regulator protein blaR1
MNQLLFYLLQVIAASGLLYGYYHFALRNKKFHRYNRFYLMMAVVISSLIPFLNIPVYFSASETESSVVLQTLRVISSPAIEEPITPALQTEPVTSTWFNAERLVYLFYILAILLFLIRVFISLNKIRSIIKKNPAEQIDKIKFVNTDEPGTPFSFFRWLFWNRKIEIHSEKGEQIFRHELFHIQQKHSWDIIFIELMSTIFWINPFFHLMKKELKAIHEFLADEFAITENKNWQYAELLLMQVLSTNTHLVNPFFHNQIKRRIAMITTSKKPSYQYLRKLMVLPVAAIIFFLFAFTYKNRKNDPHEFEKAINPITVVIDAGHGGTDAGAKTKDGKYNEAELSLAIAKKIEALGPEYNINVIMTRINENFPGGATNKSDALKERVALVNTLNPHAFIAIHMNTTPDVKQNSRSGFDGYITKQRYNQPDIQLASSVLSELKKIYATREEIKQRSNANIYVLDEANASSLLLECGFINNPADISFVTNESNQEKIAKAILKGLVTYANNLTPDQILNRARVVADTSKQLQNALVVINGEIQKKRGIQNIDTTKFPNKEFKGSVKSLGEKEAIKKYGEKGKDGVIEFFFDQHGDPIIDTIPKLDTIYWIKDLPPPAKKSPTQAQLDTWKNSKIYGVWLDGKRIDNKELTEYNPSDFVLYYNSKLSKNTVNYGKHYYQINLYTAKEYDRLYGHGKPRSSLLVREVTLAPDTTKPHNLLIVINGKPMPGVKMAALDEMLSPNDIESMSVLSRDTAIKKYGDIGKNGAIEIKAKKLTPVPQKNETIKEIWVDNSFVQDDDNKVFVKVEVEPSFPGGEREWRRYLEKNLDAGLPLKNGCKSGSYTVMIQFIVDRAGNISDVRPLTKFGYGMEDQVMSLIKKSPKWIPGIQNGRNVKAYKTQPVTFVIDGGKTNNSKSITNKPGEKTILNEVVVKSFENDENIVFEKVEVEASFPGGAPAWRKFLTENLNPIVPVDSGANEGTYTVVLQFIADKEGNVSNITALTKHGFGMEQECIRLMKLSPKWNPALQNGKPVIAYRKQPITFVITGDPDLYPITEKESVKVTEVNGYKMPSKKEIEQLATVYPNPTDNNATILFNSNVIEKGEVRMYDVMSNLKLVSKVNFVKGENKVILNVASLSSGTYIITVNSANGKATKTFKLIKK